MGNDTSTIECYSCSGSGVVQERCSQCGYNNRPETIGESPCCSVCSNSGSIAVSCSSCNGAGQVRLS